MFLGDVCLIPLESWNSTEFFGGCRRQVLKGKTLNIVPEDHSSFDFDSAPASYQTINIATSLLKKI